MKKIVVVLILMSILLCGCELDGWTTLGIIDSAVSNVVGDEQQDDVRKDYQGIKITDPDIILSETEYSRPIISDDFVMPENDEFIDFPNIKNNNILTLGTYEQDNNLENGSEAIEWVVIKVNNNEGYALIMSKYALDYMEFYGDKAQNWSDSEIRKWLNSVFLENSFSESEKKIITDTTVFSYDASSDLYKSGRGHETNDKIFLLSVDEIGPNYGYRGKDTPDEKRLCQPTEYAFSLVPKYDYVHEGNIEYWLRTKCSDEHQFDKHSGSHTFRRAAFVETDGSVNSSGGKLRKFVRPAMFIRIK